VKKIRVQSNSVYNRSRLSDALLEIDRRSVARTLLTSLMIQRSYRYVRTDI